MFCVPFKPWDCDRPCDWVCVFGCVEEAVGGLGLAPPVAVVGGVEMPFCRSAAAGEAMVIGLLRILLRCGVVGVFGSDCPGGMLELRFPEV